MRLAPVLFILLPAAVLAQAPVTERAASTAVNAATTPRKVADDDRMICKKFPVTGTLTQTKRLCARKREWDLADALRRERGSGACGTAEAPSC